MIAGIVGFVLSPMFGAGLPFSIAAAVLGHIGRKREPAAQGFWLTALITGWSGFVIGVVFIVLCIVLVVWTASMPYSGNSRYWD
jgi:hypothetical protein